MMCPKCCGLTKVTNGRENAAGYFKRRRECLKCGERFSTVETQITDRTIKVCCPDCAKYLGVSKFLTLAEARRVKVELA